jgi:hypothetical protein
MLRSQRRDNLNINICNFAAGELPVIGEQSCVLFARGRDEGEWFKVGHLFGFKDFKYQNS